MKMPDFSKFKGSVWHSALAVVCALLAAVLLILSANALKNLPKQDKENPVSSSVTMGAIEAEKNKVESEGK